MFGPDVDSSLFRVTSFVDFGTGSFPQSMIQLPDLSIAIQTSPGFTSGAILRFVDADLNGVADGPGVPIYTSPVGEGPLTQLAQAGSFFIQGNYGARSIVVLDSSMAEVGRLEFDYGPDLWWHDTIGLAVRPTPGQPGSYDLVFNVGSEFDNLPSSKPVGLSGLVAPTALNPDSLYMVTLGLQDGAPVGVSNLRQVASGIRNVFGMGFDAAGNFWFSENAMDGDPFPPQAEELNQIPVALLNALQAGTPGTLPPDFGFPNCFPSYFTGAPTGSGCGPSITSPIQAFTPFLSTLYSQGATQIAFAPSDFPAPFNHGIFIAFAGNPAGERNPLIFYDLDTGTYTHFLLGGTGSIRQTGLLSTNSSLFISDFLSGEVFQITAGGVPEPGGLGLVAFGLSVIALLRRRRAF